VQAAASLNKWRSTPPPPGGHDLRQGSKQHGRTDHIARCPGELGERDDAVEGEAPAPAVSKYRDGRFRRDRSDLPIEHRPNCSPLAVLGIALVTAPHASNGHSSTPDAYDFVLAGR
jgi:hypothetical protein